MLTPSWTAPLAGAAVFGALFGLLRDRGNPPLHALLWGAALVVGLALAGHVRIEQEAQHLFGWSENTSGLLALLRWLALAAVLPALAWREKTRVLRRFAEGAATLIAYGALAQMLPRDALAWTAAVLAIGMQVGLQERVVARSVALGIAAAWALEPFGWWLGAGLASLGADPVLASDLPRMWVQVTRLLPILAALAMVRLPLPEQLSRCTPAAALALPVSIVVAHILFKVVFAIDSAARFMQFGLIETTIWEAILLGDA